MMRASLRDLDRILRGDATRVDAMKAGWIEVDTAGVVLVLVPLAMIHGASMGSFALFRGGASIWQVVASTVKVPVLFALTLLVTFPSFYVSNALVGSRLEAGSLFRLLVASMAVILATLASLGPIVAFFSVSTTNYLFLVLLNVVACAAAGSLGVGFLLQTLHRLGLVAAGPTGVPAPDSGPLDRDEDQVLSRHVKVVFRCWIVLFALVGSQMGWLLRPFIGDPRHPFTPFRPRDSSFFRAVGMALLGVFR